MKSSLAASRDPFKPHTNGELIIRALRDPAAFEEEMLTLFRVNVIGSTFLLATYMPLLLAGDMKKIVVLSTGMGDPDFIAETEIDSQTTYAISKAALNLAIAKFHAEYKKEGVLVMGISPGVVETGWLDVESRSLASGLNHGPPQYSVPLLT